MMTTSKSNYLDNLFPKRGSENFQFKVNSNVFMRSPWIKKSMLDQLDISVQIAANIKALCASIGFILGMLIALNISNPLGVSIPFVTASIGFFLYDFYILDKIKYLDFRISADLPIFLDLLAAHLEVNSDSAIAGLDMVANSYKSVLSSKISNICKLKNISSNKEILDKINVQIKNKDLVELTQIIKISEEYGVDPASAIKDLATRSHDNQLLRSKELGQKSAATLLIPLVVFFLPVTSIIVLIPAILGFMNN